jgi:hypothetical protein
MLAEGHDVDPLKYDQYLEWMSPIPHHQHHDYQLGKVLNCTGVWILDDPEFLSWQSSTESSLLWLYSGIGTGKSCLS